MERPLQENRKMSDSQRAHRVLDPQVFDYFLDLEVDRARRYQNYVSLLSLKIEPEEGNGRLEEKDFEALVHLLREELREVDVIGRNEDGSISVILLHADLQSTEQVVARIYERLSEYTLDVEGEKKTIAVGGACCPTQASDINALKDHARRMLQKAMREGGNKFYIRH
ncbi:MAG: diguanylate cyclase [Deltaproteobacteria bacterium]|nr:MAG: diguanylate cyclase [Deltaproteobacteria bacterium]